MYLPAQHDEITTIVRYLDQQLDAICASAYGLTEEQATTRSTASELTISGIITHVTYVMRGVIDRVRDGASHELPDEESTARFLGSFSLADGQTTVDALADLAEVRAAYVDTLSAVDPDAEVLEPPAPWFGRLEATPINARYHLVHQIEELARHAGHADIIREQIDGAVVPGLQAGIEGRAANAFIQPFEAQPGTIGA